MTLSLVSLANNPSLAKALQKRLVPPASGCNSMPINKPLPRTSFIYELLIDCNFSRK